MIRIEAIGRLGNDAKLENGKNGQYVTFRLAANEFKDDEPMWFTVNVKPETCKGILPYLKKGVMVRTVGRYKDEVYTTRENKPVSGRTISAIEVNFIDNGGNKQNNIVEGNRATQAVYQQPVTQPTAQPVYQQPISQTGFTNVQQTTGQPVYAGDSTDDDSLPF